MRKGFNLMTKNQREFQRELLRLQRSIDRLTRKHRFAQSQALPEQPKRITKRMIKQLKKLTGKSFVDEIDIDTGEIIHESMPVTIYKRKPKRVETKVEFNVYAEILARFREAEQEIISQYSQSVYERDLIQARVNHIRDLIDILEYKHDEYDEKEYYGIYTAYLKANEEKIAELLTPLIYSSDQADVEYSYSELVYILSQSDTKIIGEETLSRLARAEEYANEHGGI